MYSKALGYARFGLSALALRLMGCAHVARKRPLNASGAQGIDALFLANFQDRGRDNVLELLLGLVPDYQSFTVRVGGHFCLAELDGFNFTGLPVLEGHKFFRHAIHALKSRAQINAV